MIIRGLLACWLLAALTSVAPAQLRPSATGATGPAARPLLTHLQWWNSPAATPGTTEHARPEVQIPLVATAPVCDGELSEEVWQQAAWLDDFTLIDGSDAPLEATRVAVCATETHLFVAFECHDQQVDNLQARVTKDGGSVWEDDCVEIFIDYNRQQSTFAQIVINSSGYVYAHHPTTKEWLAGIERGAKTGPEEKRWWAEVGIPWQGLKLTSSTFGFNVARERRSGDKLELSCWAPTGQAFGQPDRFGTATLAGRYLRGFQVATGRAGLNECQVQIVNDDERDRQVMVFLEWQQSRPPALYRQRGPLALKPGQSAEVVVPYDLVADEAPAKLTLMLKDVQNRELLARWLIEQPLSPPLQMVVRPQLSYVTDYPGEVEVQLALGDSLRESCVLVAALWEAGSGKLLARQVISPLAGDRLVGALTLEGLAAGRYELEVVLKTGPGERAPRVANCRTLLIRRPGPFETADGQ
jgi:hypothetical protein